jgi:transcriptional regulator of acetoin/glycerol metabolism
MSRPPRDALSPEQRGAGRAGVGSPTHTDFSRLIRTWERFLAGHPIDEREADASVLASWRRSRAHGVDPSASFAPLALQATGLSELQAAQPALVRAAAAIFAKAEGALAGSGSIMLLTNPDGVILKAAGDAATLDQARRIHLQEGAAWSEGVIGTNGIGTALATGAPAQVHAAQHFCAGIHGWTCAASPVFDPTSGELLGVIDISGPPATYQRANLVLAVSVAQQVEAMLSAWDARDRARLLDAALEKLSGGDLAEGVLALDRAGRLVHATGRVPPSLAIGRRLPGLDASVPVDEWWRRLPEPLRLGRFNPVQVQGEPIGALVLMGGRPRHGGRAAASEADPRRQDFTAILGESEPILAVMQRARRLAAAQVPILIHGETGVGKELFARAVHGVSAPNAPFVVLNCGAVPKDLLGSELFGHVRGAFTGAAEGRAGRFELADGGTLCLDEIGEMPLELQPYLLRVLEKGVIYRLGDSSPRQVRVRLLSLTNRDLEADVAAGRFRRDLYYRIGVTALRIPPLRERRADIPILAGAFLSQLADRHALRSPRLSPAAMSRLAAHEWPGNVRELRNVIESLLLTADRDEIGVDMVEALIGPVQPGPPGGEQEADTGSVPTLEVGQDRMIQRAIREAGGNLSKAALMLGISRTTLYRKLRARRSEGTRH